jgi:hypothetical protein
MHSSVSSSLFIVLVDAIYIKVGVFDELKKRRLLHITSQQEPSKNEYALELFITY